MLESDERELERKVLERFWRNRDRRMAALSHEARIEDSKAYSKPWTTSFKVRFRPGWDLLEYVCLENNKDLQHLGTTEPQMRCS